MTRPTTLDETLTQQIPPHDDATERAVLGAVLLDGRPAWDLLTAHCARSDFYFERHRQLWDACTAVVAADMELALFTISHALHLAKAFDDVGQAYLTQLESEAGLLSLLPSYAAILRQHAQRRELIRVSTEVIARAYEGRGHAAELVEPLRSATWDAPSGAAPAGLGGGLGAFLAMKLPQPEPLVAGLLSSEGGGWLGGEEKLFKTFYALEEAVCLALAEPVCGRFPVPRPCRVLFIEEEDSPRRTQTRLKALLRGHGLDPDDADVQADLEARVRVAVWEGFTFDDPRMVRRLEATIATFHPNVVYLDVLRKLTLKDLNKADQAGLVLAILDDLRRRYGVIFRVVHHYRKTQGFRVGRGSQELGGSFTLGAWAENSLFFEPIGRKHGAVKVEIQSKDAPEQAAFSLRVESEGPMHAPTLLRLLAVDVTLTSAAEQLDALVLAALGSLEKHPALAGKPGVPLTALCPAVKRSLKPVRQALKRLQTAGLVDEVGKATKQAALYAVVDQ